MTDSQRYPYKLCLIMYESRYKVTCAFLLQENNEINLEKRQYLPHFLSDTGFKGTVVNRGLPSLRRGTLENSNFSLLKIS